MRIVKLSGEVFGFDTIGGCKAFFEHVLPWEKGAFSFAGNPNKIGKGKLIEDEVILFTYKGIIVSIAKANKLIISNDDVTGFTIKLDTLRILHTLISTHSLEQELQSKGFTDTIHGSQGWNIIDDPFDKYAIKYIRNEEWKLY